MPGRPQNPVHAPGGAPRAVLVCENATTLGTLPEVGGVVAVHGMGFAAPTLAEVGWLRDADAWYWGDLDTYGFQILGLVRAALPSVRSVLMDVAAWEEHQSLSVTEPRPFRGEIGYLTAAELAALARVREHDRRLEQERIPRSAAHAALRAELAPSSSWCGRPGAHTGWTPASASCRTGRTRRPGAGREG